jgi:hypothetical protein
MPYQSSLPPCFGHVSTNDYESIDLIDLNPSESYSPVTQGSRAHLWFLLSDPYGPPFRRSRITNSTPRKCHCTSTVGGTHTDCHTDIEELTLPQQLNIIAVCSQQHPPAVLQANASQVSAGLAISIIKFCWPHHLYCSTGAQQMRRICRSMELESSTQDGCFATIPRTLDDVIT